MIELRKLPSGRVIEAPVLDRTPFYDAHSLEQDKKLYEQIVEAARKYGRIEKVTPFLKFDAEQGLIGSNLGVKILASEALGEGLRFPTVPEAMALHDAGFLTNRHLVDYAAVFFSPEGANSEKATQVAEKIKARSLKAPVILHPADLRLGKDAQTYELRDDARYIISGEEAQVLLLRMTWVGDSSFRGLGRDRDGSWVAGWDDVLDSSGGCRVVDRVRGEAAARELEAHEESYIKNEFDVRINAIESQKAVALQNVFAVFHRK